MTDAAAAGPPLPQHHQGHHDVPKLLPSIHFLLLRVKTSPTYDFQVAQSLSEPHPPGLQVVDPLQVPVGPHGLYPLNLTSLDPGPLQTVVLRHAIRSHGLSLQNSDGASQFKTSPTYQLQVLHFSIRTPIKLGLRLVALTKLQLDLKDSIIKILLNFTLFIILVPV